MTWNSGSCRQRAAGSGQLVVTDAYPHGLWISDADIRNDEAERIADEQDLLTLIAQSEPGIVRSLAVLSGELQDTRLPVSVLLRLAEHIRGIGDGVAEQAARVSVEAAPPGESS